MSKAAARPRLQVLQDRDAASLAVAELIAHALERRLAAEGGRACFVATGGSTPAPVYDRLCDRPLDWSRVDITLSDERWVAPTSPDSNERMVREHLLQGRAASARLVPLNAHAPDVETAAALTEPQVSPLAPFDVVLLGMGEDGHFASLFPGSPALAGGLDLAGERFCIGVPAGEPAPPQPRISLTLKAILASRLIVLLITGETKRAVLDQALGGADLPVRALLLQDRTPVHIYWSP